MLLAVGMIAAGLTWIFGPWGMTGTGAALLAYALFSDVTDGAGPVGKGSDA
jgi:hypothetical protein